MTPDGIEQAINRPVSRDELQRALDEPIPDDEREEVLGLVRWFTTRYPSPEDRLAYVRRAHARWRRAAG